MIGVIAIIAAQILKSSIEGALETGAPDAESVRKSIAQLQQSAPAAILCCVGLATLDRFNNKYTAVLLLITGAVAGQFIFV